MQTSEKLIDKKESLGAPETQIKDEVLASPRDQEMNEDKLSKYFAENYETFNRIYKMFEFSSYISVISFLSFLLTLLVNSLFEFTHFVSWAFAFVTVAFCIVFVNLYLKMKGMLDSAKSNSTNFGTIFTYVCFNLIAGNLLVFLVLIAFKISKAGIMMSTAFIPVYIAIAISFAYLIYILPALTSFRLWFDIALYFLLIVGALIFLIMLSDKIDYGKESIYTWIQISFPPNAIIIFYILYIVLGYLKENEAQRVLIKLILNVIGYLLVFSAVCLFFLKKSGTVMSEDYLSKLLLFLGGFIIFYDRVFKCVLETD